LDHFVISKTGIDINNPGADEKVLSFSLVQAELLRQRRDLDQLMAGEKDDAVSVARRMRQQALAESKIVFNTSL